MTATCTCTKIFLQKYMRTIYVKVVQYHSYKYRNMKITEFVYVCVYIAVCRICKLVLHSSG